MQNNIEYFYKDSIIKVVSTKTEIASEGEYTVTLKDTFDTEIVSKIDYNIDEFLPKFTKYFINKSDYWDAEAHRYLGDYLRTLRDVYNLDLMPFYNCYDGETISNLYLSCEVDGSVKINEVEKGQNLTDRYKVFAIPIKYDVPYTIALECPTNVLIAPVIWDDRQLTIALDERNPEIRTSYISLLKNNYNKNIGGSHFNTPYIFEGISSEMKETKIGYIKNSDNSFDEYILDPLTLYNLQKNLYLLIQVPTTCMTSLVAIEGNYNSAQCEKIISYGDLVKEDSEKINYYINKSFISDSDLLKINDGNMYAFSDRLIEFLTLNTIDNQDKIEFNILDVQRKLYPNNEKEKWTSIWDDKLRIDLYNQYMKMSDFELQRLGITRDGITGYVDKEIERYMRSNNFTPIKNIKN